MTDYAHTARAHNARIAKADQLARFLLAAGGSWPEHDRDRRLVEKVAGVRPSSEETWQLARDFYMDLRAHQRPQQDPGVFVGQRPSVG